MRDLTEEVKAVGNRRWPGLHRPRPGEHRRRGLWPRRLAAFAGVTGLLVSGLTLPRLMVGPAGDPEFVAPEITVSETFEEPEDPFELPPQLDAPGSPGVSLVPAPRPTVTAPSRTSPPKTTPPPSPSPSVPATTPPKGVIPNAPSAVQSESAAPPSALPSCGPVSPSPTLEK